MADTQLRIRDDAGPAPASGQRVRFDELRERLADDRGRHAATEPRVRIARALALLVFMLIIFIGGLFVGASFMTDRSRRPAPNPDLSAQNPGPAAPLPAMVSPDRQEIADAAAPSSADTPREKPTQPAKPKTSAAATPAEAAREVTAKPAAPDAAAKPPAPGSAERDAATDRSGAPNDSAALTTTTAAATAAAMAPVKPLPHLPKTEIDALTARGDAFLASRDVTTARLFYQRGADAGDGTAALRLGETFDPNFLARAHLSPHAANRDVAHYWYRAARDLGSTEATVLLGSPTPPKK
jgi:hypothetical protein